MFLKSQVSNLRQHVKAVHLQEKPFVCRFDSCGMRFSFKRVRDNHEKSGRHVYTLVSLFVSIELVTSYNSGSVFDLFKWVNRLVWVILCL